MLIRIGRVKAFSALIKYYYYSNIMLVVAAAAWVASQRKERKMMARPHPESERPLRGPLQGFDLDEEISRLRAEREWQKGRRNAITLRKGGGLNVVLLAMRAGDRLGRIDN